MLSEDKERFRNKRGRTQEEPAEAAPPSAPKVRPIMPRFKMRFSSVHDQCQKTDEDGRNCALQRRNIDDPHGFCARHEWLALNPDYREDD